MNRRPFRVVLPLLLGPILAACAAGADSPVQDVEPQHPGGEVGQVEVRSLMLLIEPETGNGAAVVTLVNNGTEPATLERLMITPEEDRGMALDVPAGITVPPGQAVNVGAQDGPDLPIPGLGDAVSPGFVPVTMVFDEAGQLTLNVLISEATGPYESFFPTLSPPPTGGGRPTQTPTQPQPPTQTQSPTQSPAPTATPTPTPTG